MRILVLLLSIIPSGSAFFLTVPGAKKTRELLKTELLDLAVETKRGLTASSEQQDKILRLFERLEKLNPTKKTLKSDLVNGVWDLQYTTSDSILGRGGFPRVGPILQTINTRELTAENSEVVNYFGVKVPRRISAALTPKTDQFTEVQFKRFQIGPIAFNAPESFKGALDITYVDDSLRLSRGDKGNIFVLTK
jgi:hypothetical protein